ncbi:uncharacterized protein isoform X2 [Rhodnius prolixus]|uniref:uncharacterized protein isoform X2 n=1 Tax=Rhodnius prolixus TaxID=13249 RepID=UPI003D18C877
MFASTTLTHEKVWLDKRVYDLAEKKYYENLAKPQRNSLPGERITEVFPTKCFVGLEKDVTGAIKVPEKVWPDKAVYDLAEKEYYEKLEKSRLISNEKVGKVPELVKKVVTELIEEDAVRESVIDEKLVNISDSQIDECALNVDTTINESAKKIDEKNARELLSELLSSSPLKPLKVCEREDNSSQILTPASTDVDVQFKAIPVQVVDNQLKQVQNSERKIHKQVFSPDKNVKVNKDKDSQTEKVDDLKESLQLQETRHEAKVTPKQNKVKTNEPQFLNDVVEIKRKTSDEKKVQDGTVKMSDTVNGLTTKINKDSELVKNPAPNMQIQSQMNVKIVETVPEIKAGDSPLPNANTDDTLTKKETKKNKKNKKRHRDEKGVTQNANTWNSLAGEVAKARQHIKNSLQCIDDIASITSSNVVVEVNNRINTLEKENTEMKQKVKELTDLLTKFEERLANIEKTSRPTETVTSRSVASGSSAKPSNKQQDEDADDGVDLFASDSEEENAEAAKLKEQRLAEYAAKKSKKPALIAKSSIVLDVKPWDDTTDMKQMEIEVRKIKTDGLLWGASKLVPLAYGIHKLQISCVVEDEKVSVDWLQETIEEIEDYVQSVDIAAFNKI